MNDDQSILDAYAEDAMTSYELKADFESAVSKRSYLESRWEDYAGWTLPYLYPAQDEDGTRAEMQNDYQSVGAQAVNNLGNKIVENLFPQYRPFFRLDLTEEQIEELMNSGIDRAGIDQLTAMTEKKAIKSMSKEGYRTASLAVAKHLITLGNALLFNPKGQKAQVFNLRDWVVDRNRGGDWLRIITRDRHTLATLPSRLQEKANLAGFTEDETELDIFTCIKRVDGRIIVWQELDSICRANKNLGVYTEANNPWHCLTWNLNRGDDYGTGLVEEYAGYFHQLSSYDEALLNVAAIASDIKILVNPMGQTDVDSLQESESGSYIYGMEGDLHYHQLEKMADVHFIAIQRDKVETSIAKAFLMGSGTTRQAERVTAEEIRRDAQELEGSLGGVYSRFAEEWQRPKAIQLMADMDNELAGLEVIILTGLEALSRTSEHDAVMAFFNDLTILQNLPDGVQPFLKFNGVIQVLAAGRGVEIEKILKTEEQVAQEQQQAQNAQAEQEAAMAQAQASAQDNSIDI